MPESISVWPASRSSALHLLAGLRECAHVRPVAARPVHLMMMMDNDEDEDDNSGHFCRALQDQQK